MRRRWRSRSSALFWMLDCAEVDELQIYMTAPISDSFCSCNWWGAFLEFKHSSMHLHAEDCVTNYQWLFPSVFNYLLRLTFDTKKDIVHIFYWNIKPVATIKKFQRSDHARLFNLERRSHLWESWSQVQRHYQVCFFFFLSMSNVYCTQCTIV